MSSLYLIAQEYRSACTQLAELELDEQTLKDTLESLSGDLETKSVNVALFARSLEADAAAIKQWARDANERASAILARAERLREYLSTQMQACGITKVEGPGVSLSFRKSSAVVIDEPGLIPAQYMRVPEPPPAAPDKRAIADAIKAGEEVPGARVESRMGLQIK